MHFHLPKPLHGWREFAGEVGIIVVGVLIALGAEQVVENVHDRREAAKAMIAVRAELGHSAGVYDERATVQTCLDRRLAELDSIISGARRTGRIPDISEIGRPPIRPVQSAAWSTALTNGTAMHFPDRQRDALSLLYSQSSSYYDDNVDEQMMWAALRPLEHSPGPIDSALLADATTTLGRLHFRNFLNGIDVTQMLEAIKAEGVKPDFVVLDEPGKPGTRQTMLALSKSRSVCHPLLANGVRVAAN